MHEIVFISTIHNEIGECNAEELYKIILGINPEVVFLEALEDTYTEYDQLLFKSFGQYHNKLEIKAIQKLQTVKPFDYVPVLNFSKIDLLERKYQAFSENVEYQNMVLEYKSLVAKHGFQYINSNESTIYQEKMRSFEKQLLVDKALDKLVDQYVDEYEKTMISNISLYSSSHNFNCGIFMCGVAHRKSIMEKIESSHHETGNKINWQTYGD